jgi:polar amino acid transport system substrate-binding protein
LNEDLADETSDRHFTCGNHADDDNWVWKERDYIRFFSTQRKGIRRSYRNGRRQAGAAAYDEPILKNIAAKNPGLIVLPGMITTDHYGFAVRLDDRELKTAVDNVIDELKSSGEYDRMVARWLPAEGSPRPMPEIETGTEGVLRFGTASITEPFSFVDASHHIVGLDIEIASLVARKMNRKIQIVNLDFGAMIPALMAGKVDMIGACITITPERAEKVLFSKPYYVGGIAALVRG